MDAAACIGCGACVAACPNASASLFTAAKITHLGLLPQGQAERYRRALEIRGDYFEAHNNLGNALSGMRRHAEAIRHHRIALEIKPDFAEALVNLGNALTAMNHHDEAADCGPRD